MSWIQVVKFFESKVSSTILYQKYFDQVRISYTHQETYGNEYVQIYYEVEVNDNFINLSPTDKYELKQAFGSDRYVIFSIHTAQERFSRHDHLKLIEFSNVYSSISSYVVLQLERKLGSHISIKVSSLDDWPLLNYTRKFMKYLIGHYGNYQRLIDSRFEKDVYQFDSLQDLSIKSKERFLKEKTSFSITDQMIVEEYSVMYDQVRRLLILNQIPIRVQGFKTINKIHIHTGYLVNVLASEIIELRKRGPLFGQNHTLILYEEMLIDLLTIHLPSKESQLRRKENDRILGTLPYKKGDLLQLTDDRLVVIKELSITEESMLIIKYAILKNNLEVGQRTKIINSSECDYYIKSQALQQYKKQNVSVRIAPFKNWVKKRRVEFGTTNVVLDYADALYRET